MRTIMKALLGLALVILVAVPAAQAAFNLSIGTDNFYVSVGDYDYLPYAMTQPYYRPVPINFYDMMGQYGAWVYIPVFGQVWHPYAGYGWRPYVYGHWIYTQYGPTWQGYEPWAWAAYHYGNWIWTQQFGWVWIPGYQWHPGRVVWGTGFGTIGWMPAPPPGYDYSRGYLAYAGQYNQFDYNDQDFGYGDDDQGYDQGGGYYGGPDQGGYYGGNQGGYYYGGPYYDPRYRQMWYNPSYTNISINLWVFIEKNYFASDDYADYYMGGDYTRSVFDTHTVRVSSRPIDRPVLERIIRQKIQEVPVAVKEVATSKQPIKVVIPIGQEQVVARNATRVVRDVIAPAFAEKQRPFKAQNARVSQALHKAFKQQENQPPNAVQQINGDEIVKQAQKDRDERQVRRQQRSEKKIQQVEEVKKEGKIREPKPKNERDRNNEGPVSREDRQHVPPPQVTNPPGENETQQPEDTTNNNDRRRNDDQFNRQKKNRDQEEQQQQPGEARSKNKRNELKPPPYGQNPDVQQNNNDQNDQQQQQRQMKRRPNREDVNTPPPPQDQTEQDQQQQQQQKQKAKRDRDQVNENDQQGPDQQQQEQVNPNDQEKQKATDQADKDKKDKNKKDKDNKKKKKQKDDTNPQ